MTSQTVIEMKPNANGSSAYLAYRASCVACDQMFRQLMAVDAFELCGGVEGWEKLRAAYDVMRAEQTRRMDVWLKSLRGA